MCVCMYMYIHSLLSLLSGTLAAFAFISLQGARFKIVLLFPFKYHLRQQCRLPVTTPRVVAQQCHHQKWFALNLSYLTKCETKMH